LCRLTGKQNQNPLYDSFENNPGERLRVALTLPFSVRKEHETPFSPFLTAAQLA
jgi:hypothetical protein